MDHKRPCSMAIVCLVLAGCGHHDPQAVAAAPRVEPPVELSVSAELPPDQLRLPAGSRLPAMGTVRLAGSWEERLATLTNAERSRLETLNARFMGVLEFDSAEDQKKLIDAGFPMPEEWLAADALSDDELAALAHARSPKGAMFYANRELDKFIEAREAMLDAGHYNDIDPSVMRPKVEAMVYAGRALELTRSPFAAYLYGSINANLFHDPAYIPASISVAWALGDERGMDVLREFERQMQWSKQEPPGISGVASAEHLMWQHVHRYRPL